MGSKHLSLDELKEFLQNLGSDLTEITLKNRVILNCVELTIGAHQKNISHYSSMFIQTSISIHRISYHGFIILSCPIVFFSSLLSSTLITLMIFTYWYKLSSCFMTNLMSHCFHLKVLMELTLQMYYGVFMMFRSTYCSENFGSFSCLFSWHSHRGDYHNSK